MFYPKDQQDRRVGRQWYMSLCLTFVNDGTNTRYPQDPDFAAQSRLVTMDPLTLSFDHHAETSIYVALAAFSAIMALLYRHLNRTDIPKIKGLPELPGVPIFGSLFLLGKYHARNCAKLAEKFGPVFQVRLGNRVGSLHW
jgi:hypothetical protein